MATKPNEIDLGALQDDLDTATKKLGKALADLYKAQCVLNKAEDTVTAVKAVHSDAKLAIVNAARVLTK